jgi:hypothetical protein
MGSVSQLTSKSGASKIRWISFFMITPPGESFFEGLSALFEPDLLRPVLTTVLPLARERELA